MHVDMNHVTHVMLCCNYGYHHASSQWWKPSFVKTHRERRERRERREGRGRGLDALLVGEERLLDAVEGVHQTLLHGVDGLKNITKTWHNPRQ